MTAAPTYTWNNPAGGAFSTPTNWSGGVIPGAADDADLVSLGAPYTVTDSSETGLNGIQTAAGTTLSFTGFHFLPIEHGTDGGINAGTLTVSDDAVIGIAGTFTNTGGIDLSDATGNFFTGFIMGSGTVLDGGGTVSLGDGTPHGHYAFQTVIGGNSSFTNVDNTISGAGLIGYTPYLLSDMVLTNDAAGVIDANGLNPLFITARSATVVNAGLMEATGTGGLVLDSAVDNSGTLAALGGTNFAPLAIAGGVTLSGAGIVTLNAKGVIAGDGPGATLTNIDNTIIGAGFITAANTGVIQGSLSVVNEADGVIDASTGRLEISLAGSTVTNAGLIEATGAGSLLIKNTTVTNTGTVTSGKAIELASSTIAGGTVMVAAGGVLKNAGASTIGGYVTNAGTINGGVVNLTITRDVSNSGLLSANQGDLTILGEVTGTGQARIAGGGVLEVDGALGELVTFADSGPGTLILRDSADFTGTVYGFSKTGANQIDLGDIAYNAANTVSYSTKTHALTVTNAGGTVLATIKLKNSYAGSTFTLSRGADNGTVITDPRATAFASAAASLGASGASSAMSSTAFTQAPPLLATPRA